MRRNESLNMIDEASVASTTILPDGNGTLELAEDFIAG